MPGLFSKGMSPDTVAALTTIMSDIRPVATRAMAHAMAEADLRDVLPSIRVPMLVVCGDADERARPAVAEALHRGIPASSLVVLRGLGHECYLEDLDRFNAEVRRFLCARA
jgi:pimeloyl-ACP methyl ester carboxylesterase